MRGIFVATLFFVLLHLLYYQNIYLGSFLPHDNVHATFFLVYSSLLLGILHYFVYYKLVLLAWPIYSSLGSSPHYNQYGL